MTEDRDKKPRVQSAARTVEILQAVARAEGTGIAANAISAQLGIPRQVVYHLAHTLTEMNILRRVSRGSYVLGPSVGAIAHGFRRQLVSSGMAADLAAKAAALTGETAYVVGWLDDEIVVVGTARGSGMIQAAEVPQGTAGHAHARASGKLLLAMADERDRARYLDRHPLTERTPNTITSMKHLEADLERIRGSWVGAERGEYEVGLSCLAVPLGAVPSMLVLGISGPSSRVESLQEQYVEQLTSIATAPS